jgi:RNA polymerase II subunit A-like phosphatase
MSLIQSNKATLILDLDHTLLHTIRKQQLFCSSLEEGVYEFSIEDGEYYVKFRPGIVKFLERINKLYDIHVYTMGTRDYANAIIKIIVHKLMNGVSVFNGKIFTRSDTGNNQRKNLKWIVPGLEHLTLILDDSPQVWGDYRNQVVRIYPYSIFRSVFNPENRENVDPIPSDFLLSLTERLSDKSKKISLKKITDVPDTHLNSMYDVLASVHHHFFKYKPINVKESLKWRRLKVLSGVYILFSAVFPLGADPKEQKLWKCAEYFGAKCETEFSNKVTHLVAAKEGTNKVLEAVSRGGIHIVTPNWLYDSLAHWVHLPEKDYHLSKFPSCVFVKHVNDGFPINV